MPEMAKPTVHSINVSAGGIPKVPVQAIDVLASGLAGDGHNHAKHNTPLQALSILDLEDIEDLQVEGFAVEPGATGENVTVRNLQVDELSVGDILKFQGGLEVELTKVRHPCYVLDSIDPALKHAIKGRCGFLGRVVQPGRLTVGETILVRKAGAGDQRDANMCGCVPSATRLEQSS